MVGPVAIIVNMGRKRARGSTFAELLADAKAHPDPRALRHVEGPCWRGPDGLAYLPWIEQLTPADAVAELRQGANVLYDGCGCGGHCPVKWLTLDELEELKSAAPPDLHRSKDGLARLEGWRSEEGNVLVVAVCEVSWGDVIPG